jgi:hypothetical protein
LVTPRGHNRSTRKRVPSERDVESYARFSMIIGGLPLAAVPREYTCKISTFLDVSTALHDRILKADSDRRAC